MKRPDREVSLSTGWRGVYAALGCAYPGTGDDRRASNSTAIDLHSYRERDKQSSGITTDGRNRSGQSVPSPTDGINIPLGSSAAAVRHRAEFSGFESDDNARRNDGGTMKTNRHHEDREQRENEPATELLADGGEAVLDLGTRVLDRDDLAGERNPAVVIALPDEPAYARTLDELDGEPSVADLNPAYGASGTVATVAFVGDLDEHVPAWRDRDDEELAGIVETTEALTGYTYPRERLRHVEDADDAQGGSA